MSEQKHFINLLNQNVAIIEPITPKFTKKIAQKLIERTQQIKLYAHSYALILNFQKSDFNIIDLLDFAYKKKLNGIDIHIDDGNKNSLRQKSHKELEKIKLYAKKLDLGINLEISSTCKEEIDSVITIAKELGVKNIRGYIRYDGHLSDIIKKGINDLKYVDKVSEQFNLFFVVEQHEVLKSKELVEIMKKVKSQRINLLFDFGNMINANENPMDALKIMTPYITQVHMKGVKKNKLKNGFEQIGVLEGEGDLPQMAMLINLLLLGKTKPQVKFYGLEQEVGFRAPPFRFDNEDENPLIPYREPSDIFLDKNKSLEENLLLEKQNACKQVLYVKNLLEQIKTLSKIILE